MSEKKEKRNHENKRGVNINIVITVKKRRNCLGEERKEKLPKVYKHIN